MHTVHPAHRGKRLLTTFVIGRLGSALLLSLGWSGWTINGRPGVALGRSLLLRSLIGLRPRLRLRPGHRRAGLRFWPVIGWGLRTRRGAIRGWPRPGGWWALPLPWPLALPRPVDRPRWWPVRHRAIEPGIALTVERPAPVVIVPVRADHETDDGDADLRTVGG